MKKVNSLPDVKVLHRNRIDDDRGWLTEILRSDSPDFRKFGQVYCSAVYSGVIKGFHRHQIQSDYVHCVEGKIKVILATTQWRTDSVTGDEHRVGEYMEVYLNSLSPKTLVIPPGIWHGWTPYDCPYALVINIPTEVYNYEQPDEERMDPHALGDLWSRKDG